MHIILDNNRFHDISAPTLNPGYLFGMYLDDEASYWTVTNNIVHSAYGAPLFLKGKSQSVTNNIFEGNGGASLLIQATNGLGSEDLTISRNIIYQASGSLIYYFNEWIDDADRITEADYNVYYYPGGSYGVGGIPGDDTWTVWKTLFSSKYDQNSDIAEPLFVDRGNHDYTVDEASPALDLGFVNIDQDSIGLKDDFPFFVIITESAGSTSRLL
jgi:hypothetical protein